MAMRKPGTYAPLSANYADDEAIMAAGEDAELLYIRMLAYAARTPLTEGWISDAVLTTRIGILPRMTGNGTGNDAGIEPGTDAGSRAQKLCDVGLITHEGTGHRIVSWLRWNKSAAEMRRESSRDRDRKANAVTSDDDGSDTGNDAGSRAGTATGNDAGLPDAVAQAEQYRIQSSTEQKHTTRSATPAAPAGPSDFDAFWVVYPNKTGKGDARKAFVKAVKASGLSVVMAGIERYAHDRNLPDRQFIPNPATWLNQGRWDDDPCPVRIPTQASPNTHRPVVIDQWRTR